MSKLIQRMLRRLVGTYSLDREAMGIVRFDLTTPDRRLIKKSIIRRNTILYSGADVLAKCLPGDWKVGYMYLEYKNLADPSDPITPPAYDRSDGIAYYNGLSGSPDTDFLRIPITILPTYSASGADYNNNQVSLYTMSEGTAGFFGKLFNESVNSAVFGAALVAAPDPADQSQDVVFSRIYAGIDKVLKEPGMQVGVQWMIQMN